MEPKKKPGVWKCIGCAHNCRQYAKGCKILHERTPGPTCWARMTPTELQEAERRIAYYRDRAPKF